MYSQATRIIESFVKLFLMTLTALIICIIIYQVFGRYVLNSSPSWSEEIARILLVWISFMGSSLIVRYRSSIRLELVTGKLFSSAWRERMNILSDLIILIFSVFTFVIGVEHTVRNISYLTEALHLPIALFTLAIPASSLFSIYFSIYNLTQLQGPRHD